MNISVWCMNYYYYPCRMWTLCEIKYQSAWAEIKLYYDPFKIISWKKNTIFLFISR